MHKDDNGKQSIAEIFEKDGKYYAYAFHSTDGSTSYDNYNPNKELQGRSMTNVVFMWNLRKDGEEWSDGKIYNYANGKTYDASAWFNKNGDLVVKASVWGIGKKFIWKKLEESEVKEFLGKKASIEEVVKTIPVDM